MNTSTVISEPEPPPPSGLRRWVKRALVATLLVGLTGAGAVGGLIWRYARELPESLQTLAEWSPDALTEVWSSDGEKIAEFYLQRRITLPFEKIPERVKMAFLAAEDARFYQHPGLDLAGIFRAMLTNLQAGRVVQGGSTITQQVVKNVLLTPERSLERKVKEAVLSIRVERELSKDEILGIYLNLVYLGHGAWGVEAAAQTYFGKSAQDMTIAECALLAGMVKAPGRNSPFRHFDRARGRQLYVIDQMEQQGFIPAEEARAAREEPLAFLASPGVNLTAAPAYVEQVRRLVLEQLGDGLYTDGLKITTALDMRMQRLARLAVQKGVEELEERSGFQGPAQVISEANWAAWRAAAWREVEAYRILGGQGVGFEAPPDAGVVRRSLVIANTTGERGGGEITVALGPFEAVLVGEALDRSVTRLEGKEDWKRKKVSELLVPGSIVDVRWLEAGEDGRRRATIDGVASGQAAMLVMEPGTGYVRAMVGGYDSRLSSFNRATQARRQPGSTFKPFIYAAAIAAGKNEATVVRDGPVAFRMPSGHWWQPHNYDGKFFGEVTLRTALAKSLNSVAARLMDEVGVDSVISTARRMGIESPLISNMTLSLGVSELTLMELTRAYATFPSGGRQVEPVFIERIETRDGRLVSLHQVSPPPPLAPGRDGGPPPGYALDPAVAFVMTDMLRGVVQEGTARSARDLPWPAAGKTGTTNDYRDAWFIGFTPELVAGVWIGNDGHHPMGRTETGGKAALPIWKRFMEQALEGRPVEEYPLPPGIVYLKVDPKSGQPVSSEGAGKWMPFPLQTLPDHLRGATPDVALVDGLE